WRSSCSPAAKLSQKAEFDFFVHALVFLSFGSLPVFAWTVLCSKPVPALRGCACAVSGVRPFGHASPARPPLRAPFACAWLSHQCPPKHTSTSQGLHWSR